MLRLTLESFEMEQEATNSWTSKEINKAEIARIAVSEEEWEKLAEFVSLIFRPKVTVRQLTDEEIRHLQK